ncbi:restriction endonuclease subunit S [Thalassolituus oleivorans]|uniref:restriction endonuclease subunit S n=1 Tax=Thalassolituus oleivorans TaxID=187493 RepID=UPI00042DCE2D|nr:restriction endonuclease subunit S [Thalassolituus oleivorans]AHK15259.1 restriction endonuclease [Thalassolituus oleivorans R6-15]
MSNKHAVKEASASYQSTPVPLVNRELQSFITGNPLTDNLNLWISATKAKSTSGRGSNKKIELVGIKKLRELILELAVRGKLVPQNPEDEPASELLKKIDAEKAKLVKEGKIKNQKSLPEVSDDEKPFELPTGWEWCRFGDATFNRDAERIPLSVSVRENRRGKYDYYGASGVIDKIDDFLFDKPLLLIGEDGANLINRSTPIAFIAKGKYWVNNHAHVIDGISEQFLIYISMYINSISLESYITGTAQPKMNQAKMNSILLALAPLAEQHRIVAKVDELMALCDQLEQHSEHQLDAHKQLVETLLATLVESENADDLATNWQRLAEHFDTLFSGALTSTAGIGNGGGEWAIDRLKDTILQLAVMGKLVPQNPDDEPASELLKQVSAHQNKRYERKEIQKPKPIKVDLTLTETLPSSWQKVLLNDIAFTTKLAGFEYSKYIKLENTGEIPVIRAQNVRPFTPDLDNLKFIDAATSEALPRSALDRSCLLVTFIGAGIGDVCVFNQTARFHLAPNVAKLEPFGATDLRYLNFFLSSPIGKKELFKSMKSTAQPSLSMTTIREIWVPLPPLAEQHRIVAKVDELFALCDQLKARLQAASETQLTLTEALVEQALQ